jgi:hypothetical protein
VNLSDLAPLIFQRPVVIALAVTGAGMATAGWVLAMRRGRGHRGAKVLTVLGYACAAVSVVVFIVAGFLRE